MHADAATTNPRRARTVHEWWWRAVLLVHAGVALVCGVQVVARAVAYWAPCSPADYDSPACLWAQTDGVPGTDSVYDSITGLWVTAVVTAVVAAVVCRVAGGPRSLALATMLPPVLVNPATEYVLTPLVNGGYGSHDTHPWSGILLGTALMVSGVIATVGALPPLGWLGGPSVTAAAGGPTAGP